MSAPEKKSEMRLDATDELKSVLDRWTEALGEVFESMANQRPEVVWRAATGSLAELGVPTGPGAEEEMLWWEQPFQPATNAVFWVAVPRATWEYAGTLTLKAAGLETIELPEVKSTWLELLGQSLGAMARSIGVLAGQEVTLAPGSERVANAEVREWASIALNFREAALAPIVVAMSPHLANWIVTPHPAETEPDEASAAAQRSVRQPSQGSRTMDLLMDVNLPLSISFGRTHLPLKDVLKLTTGSIVELNRGVHDQVEVLVNHSLIARGEVVVVDGNYGVRIQEIIKRQDRLQSLQ